MIRGSDKEFVQGKSFQFIKDTDRPSDTRKGRPCTNCGKYRKIEDFKTDTSDCRICVTREENNDIQ